MNQKLFQCFSKLMADTYVLYLKTQNYHWHVTGPLFKTYHLLFEEQYQQLAQATDDIAERILTMGCKAPATFKEYQELTSLQEGDSSLDPAAMIEELFYDHEKILKDLNDAVKEASVANDEGSVSFLGERIMEHEKIKWMLESSRNK